MHDLKFCVRHHGAVYCWDDANERIVKVAIDDIELDECPQYVIKLIMRNLNNSQEVING
jgi:hypothetical protein